MNLEDVEFAEGQGLLAEHLSQSEASADSSIYMNHNQAYWRRDERISHDLTLRISTLAYGGTHSGRKLYESSLLLG